MKMAKRTTEKKGHQQKKEAGMNIDADKFLIQTGDQKQAFQAHTGVIKNFSAIQKEISEKLPHNPYMLRKNLLWVIVHFHCAFQNKLILTNLSN